MLNTSYPVNITIHQFTERPYPYKCHATSIHLFISASSKISLPMGQRSIDLPPQSVYLFYDQNRDFELLFNGVKSSHLCILELSIYTLHTILSNDTGELDFNQADIFNKEQYHHFEPATVEIQNCIESLLDNPNNTLLVESKKFEILYHYFSNRKVKTYQCPFLNQKDNVNKVRKAKAELIKDFQRSLTIKELSKIVGLNEHNLKTGFKEIYGKPIHTYLKDYKLNKAREMIISGDSQINEIAYAIGYTNVSHFIEAFKRKFGLTPKKFEMSLS